MAFSSTIAKNPVLSLLAATLGAGPGEIGLVAASPIVTVTATTLAAGQLSDRFGRRPLLLLAGVAFVTVPLSSLVVHTPLELALVRPYHGLATAAFGPLELVCLAPALSGLAALVDIWPLPWCRSRVRGQACSSSPCSSASGSQPPRRRPRPSSPTSPLRGAGGASSA